MKVSLNIVERMALNGTLPQKSDIDTITTVQEILLKTHINAVEQKECNMVFNNGQIVNFDEKKANESREFEFSDEQIKVIAKSLNYLNKRKKLTAGHIPLFKKFMKENKK